MKFTKEHYKNLLDCIESTNIDLSNSLNHYLSNKIGNNPEKRFLWDVFWASKYSNIHREDSQNYLDSHIETAVKRAVKELIKTEKELLAAN